MSEVANLQQKLQTVKEEVGKRIVGQRDVLEQVLVCMMCDGNALLESVPGLGKTMMIRTIAEVTDLEFSRIQNTPDLMPSDITGTEVIREDRSGKTFTFQKGPIFANIILADEINRATPKTQAALLEAMQEKQVTAAGETYDLPKPFFVLATQNPIEQEGSLHPDESLYMNGRLWKAKDALEYVRENGEIAHEAEDMRIYDANTSTQTLDPEGRMTETECMLYEKEYEGHIYTFETKRGRRIKVSDNHPFLVNRAGSIQWVKARNLEEKDHLVTPQRLETQGEGFISHDEALAKLEEDYKVLRKHRVKNIKDKLEKGEDLCYEEIDDLRVACGMSKKELSEKVDPSYDQVLNFLQGAKNGIGKKLTEVLSQREITEGDYVESFKIHRIDDAMNDKEAGFFIGFILSEGTLNENDIRITQKNLKEKFDRWVEIAERIGVGVTIKHDPTGRVARVTSKPFIDYLKERYNITKPERFLNAPEGFRKSFLEIFLLTESHYDTKRRRITFTQKDRDTTNLIAYLLLQFGIAPWIYHDGRVHRLKIQGEDIRDYLKLFEWRGDEPNVENFNSSHRTTPLNKNKVERLVDVLGIKFEGDMSSREWYNSYKSLQTKRDRMADDYLDIFMDDINGIIDKRENTRINEIVRKDLQRAAHMCGLSITDIVDNTQLTKHRVWQSYSTDTTSFEASKYVSEEYSARLKEAKKLTRYLTGLVENDVFYDPIKEIKKEEYEGKVIGLSVPTSHNYVAGLGACGINHNTYPLPEAQSDRFMMKILLDYPGFDEEIEIVERYTETLDDNIPVDRILTKNELTRIQELTRQVPIADDLRRRAVEIVTKTRNAEDLEYGASPRASLSLVLAAKARAFLSDRKHVSERDIEEMAPPVLRHRVIVDFRAEREGVTPDDAIKKLLS